MEPATRRRPTHSLRCTPGRRRSAFLAWPSHTHTGRGPPWRCAGEGGEGHRGKSHASRGTAGDGPRGRAHERRETQRHAHARALSPLETPYAVPRSPPLSPEPSPLAGSSPPPPLFPLGTAGLAPCRAEFSGLRGRARTPPEERACAGPAYSSLGRRLAPPALGSPRLSTRSREHAEPRFLEVRATAASRRLRGTENAPAAPPPELVPLAPPSTGDDVGNGPKKPWASAASPTTRRARDRGPDAEAAKQKRAAFSLAEAIRHG